MKIEVRVGKKAYKSVICQQKSASNSILISFQSTMPQSLYKRKQETSISHSS